MPSGILGIFLPPQIAQRIALPEGEAIADLHITLVPLEEIEDVEALKHTVAQWAQHQVPFTARISGVGRFNALREDGLEPFYASIDSPQLSQFREALVSQLKWDDEADVKIQRDHGFTPHITLAYLPADAPNPVSTLPSLEFEVNTLSLAIGDERHELKLKGGFERVKAADDTEPPAWAKALFGEMEKAGRRNSHEDQAAIQRIHDTCKGLGATCGDQDADDEKPKGEMKAELAPNNALKAISMTDDTLYVGNYIALWGGRDLEGTMSNKVNADGSKGEYFTKSTKFASDYTDIDAVVVDFEHGRQPDGTGPGRDEPLGRVLWETAVKDDTGLWVKRALNRRNRYVKMLEQLGIFEKGGVGTSSEAISASAQKAQNGEIQIWPLRRDTLTFTPMEPRMIGANNLSTLKALADAIPQVAEVCHAKGICFAAKSEDTGVSDEAQQAIAQAEAHLLLVELDEISI